MPRLATALGRVDDGPRTQCGIVDHRDVADATEHHEVRVRNSLARGHAVDLRREDAVALGPGDGDRARPAQRFHLFGGAQQVVGGVAPE